MMTESFAECVRQQGAGSSGIAVPGRARTGASMPARSRSLLLDQIVELPCAIAPYAADVRPAAPTMLGLIVKWLAAVSISR